MGLPSDIFGRVYCGYPYPGQDISIIFPFSSTIGASTVTRLLSRMEESELIQRVRSQKDCRSNYLVMTEKGESFVPVFYQVLDNVEQLMTDGFSQEEKETLMTLLQRVLKNIINAEITGSKIPISTKKQI